MGITAEYKDLLKILLLQPNYDRIQAGSLLSKLRKKCAGDRGLWSVYLREIFSDRTGYRVLAQRLINAYLATQPADAAPEIITPDTNGHNPSDLIIVSNGSAVDPRTGELIISDTANAPTSNVDGVTAGALTFFGEPIVAVDTPRGVALPDLLCAYKDMLDWCRNAPPHSTERALRIKQTLEWCNARWKSGEARKVKGFLPPARNENTLRRHLSFLESSGAAGLLDERGKDNAGPRLPKEEVERWQGFILTHLDTPNIGNKRARQTRRRVVNLRGLHRVFLKQYPDSSLTYRQARDIYKRMPSSWFKTPRQLRTEHARGNGWLNPYANHTWSFDMTDSPRYMRYVSDQGQIEAVKFEIIVVTDEYSGVFCAVICAEPASRDQLASAIYKVAVPKEDNPMQGLPEFLHGDRGAIQQSKWLATLHEHYQRVAGVELLKTALNSTPFSPYKNGHAERVIKMLKEDFFPNWIDTLFPACKPIINDRSGEVEKPPRSRWHELPSIEQAQLVLDEWTEMAVREIENSQSGMTRAEVYEKCRLEMLADNPRDPRLKLSNYDVLRKVLLQRDEVTLTEGGFIKYKRLTFRAPELQDYADNYGRSRVQLWFDPCDMRTALVFGLDGKEICTAQADAPFLVGDKLSLKRYAKVQKANRERRQADRAAKRRVMELVESGRADIAEQINDAAQRAALKPRPSLEVIPGGKSPAPNATAGQYFPDADEPVPRANSVYEASQLIQKMKGE